MTTHVKSDHGGLCIKVLCLIWLFSVEFGHSLKDAC